MRACVTVTVAIALMACLSTSAFAGFAGKELILPAIGRLGGVGGSQFYTTVWVTNSSAAAVDYQISFLVSGSANPSPLTVNESIGPGSTKVYENIAETLFGIKGILGAARIRSSGDLLVSSRIYNQFPGQGIADSTGLFYSAIPSRFGVAKGERAVLQGARQNAQFRYNIFLVETAGEGAVIELRVTDGTGVVRGQISVQLQQFEQRVVGIPAIVGGPLEDGTIEATTIDGGGRVIISGAQVANGSQDGTGFEMAFRSELLGSGTITGVTAGDGLTGGGTEGNVTIGIAPGGVRASMIAPGSVVTSLNGKRDDVQLIGGANVAIVERGDAIEISTTASETFAGSLEGDVTGPQHATVVERVGGQSATNVAGAAAAVNAATSTNAPGTIVRRDSSGNFSAGTITAGLNGNAATATSATNFSGSLAGEVTGTQSATVVSNAVSTNGPNAIVRRDSSGNFNAGTITAGLNGNATTATSATNFSGSLAGEVTGTQSATLVSNAVSTNGANSIVRRDSSGNFSAGTITAGLNGNATSATNFSGSLAGEVTGTQSATVVSNAVSTNGANAIVRRDASGNFSAGTITASLNGNAATATSTTNFSGSLSGEVTGTQGATVVSNAVSANTANAIVRRDGLGGFEASTVALPATGAITIDGAPFLRAGGGTGTGNTFVGPFAGTVPLAAANNTAVGYGALNGATGSANTAIGQGALQAIGSGFVNTALGNNAGSDVVGGSFNIHIGHSGFSADSSTIRIGFSQTTAFIAGIRTATVVGGAVYVDPVTGQLGVAPSSRRYKHEIDAMGNITNRLMDLRPVTFRYVGQGRSAPLQYGLIAEEVAEIYPELVTRNENGEIEAVMYQYLAPMLLDVVQKQQKAIESMARRLEELERRLPE